MIMAVLIAFIESCVKPSVISCIKVIVRFIGIRQYLMGKGIDLSPASRIFCLQAMQGKQQNSR